MSEHLLHDALQAQSQGIDAVSLAGLPLLRVRIIRYRVERPGKRTRRIVLVTTLLDQKLYPADELAALYGRRWEIEVDLDHLKTTLGMDVLWAESPEVVIKEVWDHFLAYNLVITVPASPPA
ncbi:MAG TPA: transposase [Planctomycetota bacterium]|nr:transposase [Planctomycetota bacterium]